MCLKALFMQIKGGIEIEIVNKEYLFTIDT